MQQISIRTVFLAFWTIALGANLFADERDADRSKRATPRRFHVIKSEMRSAMKAESLAKSATDRTKSVVQLTDLYHEIMTDPRRAESPTLDEYRAKIRNRLLRVTKKLKSKATSRRRSLGTDAKSKSIPFAGKGGRAQVDNADALIELIQTTISPDTWDVNGGLGTIRYFARKHALVVRAPSRIQQDVGQVLQNVRNAGQ